MKNTFKQLLKSKTVRVAILQAIIGIVSAIVAADPKLQALGATAVLKSVLDIALRLATIEPIEAK